MSHLNQINPWNKPTQHKKQMKQLLFDVFLSFFAVAPNAPPLNYIIQSEKEARVDGTKNLF